mmetsp:Transcript_27176/g.80954  ORF Transcript_27176/g.80954 Transcript_27176/m.80954 type:complete len:375 (-) Transcript_27176:2925-4049(-)
MVEGRPPARHRHGARQHDDLQQEDDEEADRHGKAFQEGDLRGVACAGQHLRLRIRGQDGLGQRRAGRLGPQGGRPAETEERAEPDPVHGHQERQPPRQLQRQDGQHAARGRHDAPLQHGRPVEADGARLPAEVRYHEELRLVRERLPDHRLLAGVHRGPGRPDARDVDGAFVRQVPPEQSGLPLCQQGLSEDCVCRRRRHQDHQHEGLQGAQERADHHPPGGQGHADALVGRRRAALVLHGGGLGLLLPRQADCALGRLQHAVGLPDVAARDDHHRRGQRGREQGGHPDRRGARLRGPRAEPPGHGHEQPHLVLLHVPGREHELRERAGVHRDSGERQPQRHARLRAHRGPGLPAPDRPQQHPVQDHDLPAEGG